MSVKVLISFYRFFMDFHKIKFIGSGGQGEVFKACHILDKQWYAIKKVDLSRK
jgi:serine/threonine protein kinase